MASVRAFTFAAGSLIACAGSTNAESPIDAAVVDVLPPGNSPTSCTSGAAGAGQNCGASQSDDCCSTLDVPGSSFDRDFAATDGGIGSGPGGSATRATVSTFQLDKYEVTVGRYRAFVNAYPSSRPNTGDGAHERIPGSGWDPSWPNPADAIALLATFQTFHCNGSAMTPEPAANENKPITCVTWYEAFAFCAWDHGRLPTAAEINNAVSGGPEARFYPWSVPPTSIAIDHTLAAYSDSSPQPLQLSGPENVGSHPAGAGRWGHLDLAGNAAEWVLDVPSNGPNDLPVPCTDCAKLAMPGDTSRETRGGSWYAGNVDTVISELDLENTHPSFQNAGEVSQGVGVRCARRAP